MLWRKCYLWKAGSILAGVLFLLMLTIWLPAFTVHAQHAALTSSMPTAATAQPTPTVDVTVTALQKEQLTQQIVQEQHTFANWLWNNGAALVSSLVLVLAGAFTLFRYLSDQRNERTKQREDRQSEREKRAEERFQSVVEGLGSKSEEARVGAAIMLRTFLQPGYERFYRQTFDLAVAHLRLREAETSAPEPPSPTGFIPLDSLSQALITVFKESFPLARNELKKTNTQFDPQQLDATAVRLDNAYLRLADLAKAWLIGAFLRKADLFLAHLEGAYLLNTHLEGAHLIEAYLIEAHLEGADLRYAHLEGAYLKGANPEAADSLEDTKMNGVTGLTPEQREECTKKGAII